MATERPTSGWIPGYGIVSDGELITPTPAADFYGGGSPEGSAPPTPSSPAESPTTDSPPPSTSSSDTGIPFNAKVINPTTGEIRDITSQSEYDRLPDDWKQTAPTIEQLQEAYGSTPEGGIAYKRDESGNILPGVVLSVAAENVPVTPEGFIDIEKAVEIWGDSASMVLQEVVPDESRQLVSDAVSRQEILNRIGLPDAVTEDGTPAYSQELLLTALAEGRISQEELDSVFEKVPEESGEILSPQQMQEGTEVQMAMAQKQQEGATQKILAAIGAIPTKDGGYSYTYDGVYNAVESGQITREDAEAVLGEKSVAAAYGWHSANQAEMETVKARESAEQLTLAKLGAPDAEGNYSMDQLIDAMQNKGVLLSDLGALGMDTKKIEDNLSKITADYRTEQSSLQKLEPWSVKEPFIGPLPKEQENNRPQVITGYNVPDYLMSNINAKTGKIENQALSVLKGAGFSDTYVEDAAKSAEVQSVLNNLGKPTGSDGRYTDLQVLSKVQEGKVNVAQLRNAGIKLPKDLTENTTQGQLVELQARAQMGASHGVPQLIEALRAPDPVKLPTTPTKPTEEEMSGMLANLSYTAWKKGGRAAEKLADKYGSTFDLTSQELSDLKRYGVAQRVAFGASAVMPASAKNPNIAVEQTMSTVSGAGQAMLAAPLVLGESASGKIKNPVGKWVAGAGVSGAATAASLIYGAPILLAGLGAQATKEPVSTVSGAAIGMASMVGKSVTPWKVSSGAEYGQSVVMTGFIAGPAAKGMKRGTEARIRPDTITADALSVSFDVGRIDIPKEMPKLAARQLVEDVVVHQLNGEVSASRLQSLHNVPGIDSVSIAHGPRGTVDISIKSADGNVIGHISGTQRVLSEVIYHATPNSNGLLTQVRLNGWNAAMKAAEKSGDSSRIAVLNKLKEEGFIENGYSKIADRLKAKIDPETAKALDDIRENGYFTVVDLGAKAHHGFFTSPQTSQAFAFRNLGKNGANSPAVFGIRVSKGEIKSPPLEVLDSPNLKVMRRKMEALAESGKLEPGVYALYKGYKPNRGSATILEYELYSPPGTKFKTVDPTWYAPSYSGTPKMKTTSLVDYKGKGAKDLKEASDTAVKKIESGQQIPLYWMATEQAVAKGLGVPSLAQVYSAKLLGDLTLLRMYAPHRLRFKKITTRESDVSSRNPLATSFRQVELKSRPEDTGAGRVSAIIENKRGKILLARTLGQERFDLPGGGVAEKISMTSPIKKVAAKVVGKRSMEAIDEAISREVREELGLRPKAANHVDVFDSRFNPGDKPRKFQIFEVEASGKVSKGREVAEYVWWDGKSSTVKGMPVAEFAKEAIARRVTRNAVNTRQAVADTMSKLADRAKNRAVKGEDFNKALSDELNKIDKDVERTILEYNPKSDIASLRTIAETALHEKFAANSDREPVSALSSIAPDDTVDVSASDRAEIIAGDSVTAIRLLAQSNEVGESISPIAAARVAIKPAAIRPEPVLGAAKSLRATEVASPARGKVRNQTRERVPESLTKLSRNVEIEAEEERRDSSSDNRRAETASKPEGEEDNYARESSRADYGAEGFIGSYKPIRTRTGYGTDSRSGGEGGGEGGREGGGEGGGEGGREGGREGGGEKESDIKVPVNESDSDVNSIRIPDGSITWAMGTLNRGRGLNKRKMPQWWYLPPPYDQTDAIPLQGPPIGARFTGSINPKETIQIIGVSGATVPDLVEKDLGWTDIQIIRGRKIKFKAGGQMTNVGTRDASTGKGISLNGEGGGTEDLLDVDEDQEYFPVTNTGKTAPSAKTKLTRNQAKRKAKLSKFDYMTSLKGFDAYNSRTIGEK